MANMSSIASMLAQSGTNIGKQIGAPVASFGQGLGGMLTARQEKQEQQAVAQEVQSMLKKHANDPAQLNALGQKYASEGNNDMAKLFFDAAKATTAKEATGQQRGVQGGLMAITQAASRGVALKDLQDAARSVLAQGGTQAQIMEAYEAGSGGKKAPVTLSAGAALVDPETGKVIAERGFKPEAADAPKVSFVKTKDDKQVLVFEGTELVNTIEPEGDTDEEIDARDFVSGSATATLVTVREALATLDESYAGVDPGGISGALTSLLPGSPSHELMTSTYVTIAGKEALDEINKMKAEAAKFGSRGTGLGQVTQIEFAALQGNLAKLNTGLTVERQKQLLRKIEQKLVSARRIASGENPIDVIDFNDPTYIEAGYIKEGGEVYYFAPNGKEFIYDRNKESFVPYAGD